MIRIRPFVTLCLSVLVLLIAVLPASASEGIPGAPPVAPSATWRSPSAFAAAGPRADCGGMQCIFLPTVFGTPPPPPPWINTADKAASLKAFREQHEIAVIPNPQWTGNRATCDPGDTSAEFKELILRRINYFRGMAGVPAVITFNPEYSRRDQAAALMISVNRQIVSLPPNTWQCYSAEGAEAFLASNLIINGYGPDAMRGYMRDAGASNGAVGHRRWLLYPQTRQMGTGDVPQSGADPYANALWIFDENLNAPRPQTRDTYVAWPPPGYVPYRVVFARWSFSHPGANFDQATVSVTANGTPVPISVETPVTGYGENTLVWIQTGMADNANWPKPAQDDWYQVTIQNVMIGANSVDFSYWVTIFDPDA